MKLLIILSSCLIIANCNMFDEQMKDYKLCEEKCEMSFPQHTSSKLAENRSCRRGCRFYALETLLQKHSPHMPATTGERCKSDCGEAYSNSNELIFGCNAGCSAGETVIKENEEATTPVEEQSMIPLMTVREIASRTVGTLHSIKTSFVSFFKTEDNSIVAIRGPTKISFSLVPAKDSDDSKAFLHHQPGLRGENVKAQKIRTFGSMSDGANNYLIMFLLGTLAICTIYLMHAMISVSRSGKKRALLNKELIMPSSRPVKLIRPEDLTKLSIIDDDDMAGPLPVKVKLPDSTV